MKIFNEHQREFNASDIGKVFWRVGYQGVITQLEIYGINEKSEAVLRLITLTDLSNEEYKLKDDPQPLGSSTYGSKYLRENKSNEYFFDLEEAKKISFERFETVVNPNGIYRIARYFDDVFEGYESEGGKVIELSKKEAKAKAQIFNNRPRHYVSYAIVAVK